MNDKPKSTFEEMKAALKRHKPYQWQYRTFKKHNWWPAEYVKELNKRKSLTSESPCVSSEERMGKQ